MLLSIFGLDIPWYLWLLLLIPVVVGIGIICYFATRKKKNVPLAQSAQPPKENVATEPVQEPSAPVTSAMKEEQPQVAEEEAAAEEEPEIAEEESAAEEEPQVAEEEAAEEEPEIAEEAAAEEEPEAVEEEAAAEEEPEAVEEEATAEEESEAVEEEAATEEEPEAKKEEPKDEDEESEAEEAKKDESDDDETERVTETIIRQGKRIFVQYIYGFRAKLIQSDDETKARYGEVMDEIRSYPKIKAAESFKKVRVYSGRTPLCMLLFRGKILCVAFALNPADYAETKYHGEDMSEIKRFAQTPMLLRLKTPRKVVYFKKLLADLAERYGFAQNEPVHTEVKIPYEEREPLIERKLIKVLTSEETEGPVVAVHANVAQLIRDQITMHEAQVTITDEVAATLVEEETPEMESQMPPVLPRPKAVINVDTLSQNFAAGDTVTIQALKEKKLIDKKVNYVKVLARGTLNKPLTVMMPDFSLDAVKMIALTGGKAIRLAVATRNDPNV